MSIRLFSAAWKRLRPRPAAAPSERCFAIEPLEDRIQLTTLASQHLPDLTPLVSRQDGYVYKWIIDRREEQGHTLLRLTTAMANIGQGPLELRGGETVGTKQQVFQRIYNADGEGYTDRLAGTFTYHPTHHHTHFDNFAAYRLRDVTADNGVGRVIREGTKVSFCLTDSELTKPDLPGSPQDPVYDACSSRTQGISVGWADVYSQSLDDQWIDVTGVKSGKYWLEVAVDPANHLLESNENNNVKRIQISYREATRPRNDNFADRSLLKGRVITTHVLTTGATNENQEPPHAKIPGGSSVWWKWTAPVTGKVTVSTAGSNFDTLLGVYTGNSLAKLSQVAANDDDPAGERTSKLTFQAVRGTTYQIAVDGYRGATGQVKLSIGAELMSDEHWMRLAIDTARTGMSRGNSPFGACLVRDDRLIVAAHNTVLETTDITAHAEVNALRQACSVERQVHLSGCTIYSTCEPCPMCFAACHWAALARVVHGAAISDAAGAGFNELSISNDQIKRLGGSRLDITRGILRAEAAQLFKDWLAMPGHRAY